MKIAFIDNLSVGGGLSRFSLKLCESLIKYDKDLEIHYFIHENNLKQIPEINNVDKRVLVKVLKTTKKHYTFSNFCNKVIGKIFTVKLFSDDTIKEIETLVGKEFDLTYFPCAHMMEMPTLQIPVVATIHDFNWRYFFGTEIFSNEFVKKMDVEIQKWMNNAFCISSAHDVVNEAKILYPNQKKYPEVIPIAQVTVSQKITEDEAKAVLLKKGIDYPYVIFPGNFFPHKNHLNLFTAFSILKKNPALKNYKLMLTGMGTEKIKKGIATYRGIRNVTEADDYFDVIGLGYQSNSDMDALIMKANLLVSPSIYEAICTPAMDAWSFGTPTAISDIPPFREHETCWKIHSAFFDPMNPYDIAVVLENCLLNVEETKKTGLLSQEKLAVYDWDKIAESYMKVFLKATIK